ncbi:MAG: hypothetical protein MJ074_06710 [Oscillospiraceae bacterium]|nr:hypothetical protein [Oscillospiraceae bacterium]
MAYVTVSIGSGLVDSLYGKSQFPIKSFLEKQGEAFEQQSLLKKLYRMEKSKHWAERYTGETAMDDFEPVGEGGEIPRTGFEETNPRDIVNETWKQSFSLTRELVDDGNLGEMKKRANKLITAYDRTREKFGRVLYAGGLFGTEVKVGSKKFNCAAADGKPLFATNHASKVKGGSQSNLFEGDFTASHLDEVETFMQNVKGDNGELLGIAPDTIWIPNDAAIKRKVFEVVGADRNPDAAGANGFNFQVGRWNIIVDPYFRQALNGLGKSAVTPWVLLDSKFMELNDGPIFQDRVKLEVNSTIDQNNHNNVWDGYARFSAGFVDWRFAAAGGMTGGTALT